MQSQAACRQRATLWPALLRERRRRDSWLQRREHRQIERSRARRELSRQMATETRRTLAWERPQTALVRHQRRAPERRLLVSHQTALVRLQRRGRRLAPPQRATSPGPRQSRALQRGGARCRSKWSRCCSKGGRRAGGRQTLGCAWRGAKRRLWSGTKWCWCRSEAGAGAAPPGAAQMALERPQTRALLQVRPRQTATRWRPLQRETAPPRNPEPGSALPRQTPSPPLRCPCCPSGSPRTAAPRTTCARTRSSCRSPYS